MRKTLIARSSLLFVSIALFIGVYALPGAAQADTIACGAPVIGDFTPHVYGGHLDSFDYYVSDPSGTSYLPLSTTVAGKAIDLNYVSVWHTVGTNRVMIHVDVPDELAMPSDVTIDVGTLQITQGPPPVCISQATFHVNQGKSYTPAPVGAGNVSNPTPVSSNPTPISVTPTPITSHPTPVSAKPATTTHPTPAATSAPTLSISSQCQSIGSWWLLLLAVLDVVVSAILLLLMSFIAHSNGRLIAAVLIPPAAFIALWYFINTCHGDIWFPIMAVILAIIILTGSGTPDYFETTRRKIMQFFGKRTRNTQLKLAESTSIMEVRQH